MAGVIARLKPGAQTLPRADFDADTDVLYFRLSDRPNVAEHLHDETWLLRHVETGKPLGIMTEDWERVYLKRHPDLALLWHNARPSWHHEPRKMWAAFGPAFLGLLRRENPDLALALTP